MKYILSILLLAMSPSIYAEQESQQVKLISLDELGKNIHRIKFQALASNTIITVNVKFNMWQFMFSKNIDIKQHEAAIQLLKEQLESNTVSHFGFFNPSLCLVDERSNVYRSDALDLYDEDNDSKTSPVVYSHCD